MCQYNSSCRVGRHRPGTVCPLAGSRDGGRLTTAPVHTGFVPRPSAGASRFASSAWGAGISGADLVVIFIVVRVWDRFYEFGGWWAVATVFGLLLVPFVIAVWLSYRCTAWNGTNEGRCRKPRSRLFRRCELDAHSRAKQPITLPEVVAVASLLIGLADAWLLLTLIW